MLLALAAVASVPAADKTPAAARAVVARYYQAIDRGRYREAYRLWAGGGAASGKSYGDFVRGFATTARSRVATNRPTESEGAAGSIYITVPVTVTASHKDGTRQRFRGSYVLRRVNDVDGATADQLRWHIASAKLRRV